MANCNPVPVLNSSILVFQYQCSVLNTAILSGGSNGQFYWVIHLKLRYQLTQVDYGSQSHEKLAS